MKILIVDDEQIMRNGLRVTVDWESYGFEIIDVLSYQLLFFHES